MIALTERIGHDSSMSVGNVVRLLQLEGNAIRITAKNGETPIDREGQPSPHAKRTYRIALTDEFIATLPPLAVDPEPEPAVDTVEVPVDAAVVDVSAVAQTDGEHDYELPPDVDYDLMANAILGVVFNNLTASADVQELRALRKELTEAKAALVEARQVIDALGEELKTERKFRGQVEDEAAALLAKVEELEFQARNAGKNNGWDKVPVDRYKEIRKIMQAVPTARG